MGSADSAMSVGESDATFAILAWRLDKFAPDLGGSHIAPPGPLESQILQGLGSVARGDATCRRHLSVGPAIADDERFGLSLQMRKAGVSIPSDIAEGSGHRKNRVYVHHLRIARGSDAELETQLELLARLKYASPDQVQPLLAKASEAGRMLNGLIRALDSYDRDS
jgi:four helix bundle protein